MNSLTSRRSDLRALAWIIGSALLAASTGAMAQDIEDRPTSEESLVATARIIVRSDRQSVFTAFADAERMSQFWFTRRDDGLQAGETVTWYLGSADDAPSFEVSVVEVAEPERIVIEWPDFDGTVTRVAWLMEETPGGDTLLTITESGFQGSPMEIAAKALNSTGGFNQVILAAKALIEHDVSINVVADHP